VDASAKQYQARTRLTCQINRFKTIIDELGLSDAYCHSCRKPENPDLDSSLVYTAVDCYINRDFHRAFLIMWSLLDTSSEAVLWRTAQEKILGLIVAFYCFKKLLFDKEIFKYIGSGQASIHKKICSILTTLAYHGVPSCPFLLCELIAYQKENASYAYILDGLLPVKDLTLDVGAICCGSFYAFGHQLTFGWIEYLKNYLGLSTANEGLSSKVYLAPHDFCANQRLASALEQTIGLKEDTRAYLDAVRSDPNAEHYMHLNSIYGKYVDEFSFISYLHLMCQEFNKKLPSLYDHMMYSSSEESRFLDSYELTRHEYYVLHFRDGGFKMELPGKDPLRNIPVSTADIIIDSLSRSGRKVLLLGESRSTERYKGITNVIVCKDVAEQQFIALKHARGAILNASGVMNSGQVVGVPTLLLNSMPTIPYYSPWVCKFPKIIATKSGCRLRIEDIVRLGLAGSDLGTVNAYNDLMDGKINVIEHSPQKTLAAIDKFTWRLDSWYACSANQTDEPFRIDLNSGLADLDLKKFQDIVLRANVIE